MTELVRLVEMQAYRLSDGASVTLRFSTKPGYMTWDTDTPSSTPYLPKVSSPADVLVSIPSPGSREAAKVDIGSVVLENAFDRVTGTRPLNYLLTDYVLAGGRITEKLVYRDQPYSTAATVFVGTMELPEPERGVISIPIRDRSLDFDIPLLTETYTGTGGLNGSSDMTGKTKERTLGWVAVLAPTYLGIIGGKHTYSVNGGHPIEDVVWFADGASRLTKVAGTPAATQWSVDVSTGVITVGGDRPGAPTCEVKGDKTGGTFRKYVGELCKWAATSLNPVITTGEVDSTSVTTLDATPRTIGRFYPMGSTETLRSFLDEAVGSIWGGYWLMGVLGMFRVGRVPSTGGTVAASYAQGTNAGQLTPLKDSRRLLPAKQVIWRYAKNYAGSVTILTNATEADAKRHSVEWLEKQSSVNTAVANAYRNSARVETIEGSLLVVDTDAAAEVALAATDLSTVKRLYSVTVWDAAPSIDLTSEIEMEDNIAGFETGGRLIVLGRDISDKAGHATLTCKE